MMCRHGSRVNEAVGLHRIELGLGCAHLWVSRLKGGLSVEPPVAGDELRAVRRYFATRADRLPWLLLFEGSQLLTRQAVNYRMGAAAERASLTCVPPHALRHSCGFALANEGHERRLLQDYLGRRGLRNTVHHTRTAGRRFEAIWSR